MEESATNRVVACDDAHVSGVLKGRQRLNLLKGVSATRPRGLWEVRCADCRWMNGSALQAGVQRRVGLGTEPAFANILSPFRAVVEAQHSSGHRSQAFLAVVELPTVVEPWTGPRVWEPSTWSFLSSLSAMMRTLATHLTKTNLRAITVVQKQGFY